MWIKAFNIIPMGFKCETREIYSLINENLSNRLNTLVYFLECSHFTENIARGDCW
jgi:hypothetical protein